MKDHEERLHIQLVLQFSVHKLKKQFEVYFPYLFISLCLYNFWNL